MRLLALLVLVAGLGAPLSAQRRAELQVELPAQPEREGPLVRGVGVLADSRLRDLMRNGFPTRMHYRVELWSTGGWLNDLEGSIEWDVVVRYDPLDHSFQVARIVDNDRVTLLGRYTDVAGAQAAAERPFRAAVRIPRRGRRYYYNARLTVESLSLRDLDEVERWLRGELRPAVRGEHNPGTAVARGLRTLFVRLVGGEHREYERRTGTFVVR